MASKWFESKSIAIIGNASYLFDSNYGKQIDNFDVVVRINKGYLNLSNKHQGSKTDVLAYNNYAMIDRHLDLVKNYKLIHMSEKFREKKMIDNIFFYPLKCLQELKKKLNFDRPSTGLMIIDYILGCNPKSIDLFGFDFKKTPTYYEKSREIEPHNFELEKKYVSTLNLKINGIN